MGLVLVFLFLASFASNYTVKAQTRTLIVPDQYQTIQDAISNAMQGDTVFVKEGTYFTNNLMPIVINKPLSLIGENPRNTIIDGVNKSSILLRNQFFWGGIEIFASAVTVSGFTIKNCDHAISLDESSNGYRPISTVKILNNNIINNSEAIVHVSYSDSDFFISNNNITNNDSGIRLEVSDSIISENNFFGNKGTAISIYYNSSNVSITNNIIANNTDGIKLGNALLTNIYGNNVSYNEGFGTQFYGVNNAILHGNNIIGNLIGIELANYDLGDLLPKVGSGNRVYYNNLVGNAKNALVQNSYPYNGSSIYGFRGNGTDVVSWDNGSVGNYWSDYKGNGTYVIDQNNIDYHPLTQPVDISIATPTALNPFVLPVIVLVIAISIAIIFAVRFRRHRKTANLVFRCFSANP